MSAAAVPTLLLIALAAVVAPIVAEGTSRFLAIPEVVLLILFGVLLGPHALGVAHPNSVVSALADFGLTYLMFLAGAELDVSKMREGRLRLAVTSWLASLVIALVLAAVLVATHLVKDTIVVALCLTTTALGTLLPMLRDRGVIGTRFGAVMMAVGSVGEFGPVVAVAILLTTRDPGLTIGRLALFVVVAVVAALLATQVHPPRMVALLRRHLHTSSQLPVRFAVLIVVFLAYLALKLGLDVLLGAFAAGVTVRAFIAGEDSEAVAAKLEAIGFGFLIPIFFVVSGINFDLTALVHQPRALVRVPLFLGLFLVTRGCRRSSCTGVCSRGRSGARWPSSPRRACP